MGKRWDKEECNLVEDKWGIWSVPRLSKVLGRSEIAIIRYAEKNGLGSMYKGSYLTTTIIGKMFGVDEKTVNIYWIGKYGLKATKRPLRTRKYWRIKLDDLIYWCEHNQDKWKSNSLEEYALGCEPQWLKEKRIKDKDIKVIKSKTYWTMNEINMLKQLISEGFKSKEIADKLGRTKSAVDRQKLRQKSI